MILGLFLAILVGISLGLLGGGGSILTVPIFVYILGWEPKVAIAASLAVVGITSLFGVIPHHRQGNLNYRLAAIFAGVAMMGAYLGAKLSVFFSGAAQLILFAMVMAVAAFFMLKPKNKTESDSEEVSTGHRPPLIVIILGGFATGVLTGLVGVGGGFMIVPALALLARVPMKIAVGTSLLIIALNSFVGFVGYLGLVSVPWRDLLLFSMFAVVGIFIGSQLAKIVPAQSLKKLFGIFLIIMSFFVFYKNIELILSFFN